MDIRLEITGTSEYLTNNISSYIVQFLDLEHINQYSNFIAAYSKNELNKNKGKE